jgi:hypothetical protein
MPCLAYDVQMNIAAAERWLWLGPKWQLHLDYIIRAKEKKK